MTHYIDTHTHLHAQDFDTDRASVVERATAAGVRQLITLGTDVASSEKALQLAESYPGIFAAVGIHPSDAHLAKTGDVSAIEALARHNQKALAIGEIGLDFYWDTTHYAAQYEIFGQMLRLAEKVNLPVVIHNRSAQREMEWFFQEEKFTAVNGVMHCFAGEIIDAKFYLDMGLHISFTANITYKNFQYPDVVKYIPLDRTLLETDSPYMAPAQRREERNEPANVIFVAERLAEIHRLSVEEIARITNENAQRLFNLPSI